MMAETTAQPSGPFVSRSAELHQLHQALESIIHTRQPRFVLIQGDFGMGKTALIEHFLAEVSTQHSSVLIGRGKCSMETELNGLVPFSQLFADLGGQGIKRRVVPGTLADFTKGVAPAWLDVITGGVYSAIVKTAQASSRVLTRSMYSQENLFVQFTNALSRLAERQPVVAFIDDLHWADATSLELLFHSARNLKKVPVLFIGTYRPVEAMETGTNALLFRKIHAELIRYGAIEVKLQQGLDIAEYVTQRYPLNAFSPDFVAHVQNLTGGHALFVSQLFSLWENTGVVTSTQTPGGRLLWRTTSGKETDTSIPETLGEVLEERVRLLEVELREVLTCASVEGEDFTAQVVARLRRLDEYRTYDNLETLERRYRLIQEQGTRHIDSIMLDFYRFAHRFIREHLYDSLSIGKRRLLHRQVGECLEALYSDQGPIAGQLALHFREAHEPVKAARYALMAARLDQSRFAWTEGEKWCEIGLALIDTMPADDQTLHLRLDLLEQSGYGHFECGEFIQAVQRYQEALTLGHQLSADAQRLATIHLYLADAADYAGLYEQAATFLTNGKRLLADATIPLSEVHVGLDVSLAYMEERRGNTGLAIENLLRALKNAQDLPPTPSLERIKAEAYNVLGTALGNLGRYLESSTAFQKAIELAESINYPVLEAICLLNLADDCLKLGELDQSMRYTSKGLTLAQQVGDLDDMAYAFANRGAVLLARGRPQEAIDELTRAMTLSDQLGSAWNMPYIHADLALSYLALSDLEAAYHHAGIAQEHARDSQFELGYALDVLAQVEAAQKNWASATKHFEQAMGMQQKAGHHHFAARAQRHYAEALLQQGERQKARELLRTALAAFKELNLAHEISETQRVLTETTTQEE